MIEPNHCELSVTRQCQLLGLPRASYYHQPQPEPAENLRLMRIIDKTYLSYPFFGSRQMNRWLRRPCTAPIRPSAQTPVTTSASAVCVRTTLTQPGPSTV